MANRVKTNLTLDPTWKERGERMATARGLSLSTLVQELIRAEFERERERKGERRGARR